MRLQFLGASGTVTGSCYLLSTYDQKQILIDLGMFQGPAIEQFNHEPLSFDPKNLSAVFLTHAHLDHCGRLPLLIQQGYAGKIYMTKASKLLVGLALEDAVKISTEHTNHNHNNTIGNHQPLYTEVDVQRVMQLVESIEYGQSILLGDLSVTYKNAGHILGSASLEVHNGSRTIVFSGDLGNPHQKLLQPTAKIIKANIVIMESTYGDRIHPKDDVLSGLQNEINAVEKSQGVLLIPAFALDRTQVILHMINHLKKDGRMKNETPVFLDSPMGIKATIIYKESKDMWSDELKGHTDDPFGFPNLYLTREAVESEHILKVPGPKIVIAGNGMISGGRIWHHLINYLPLPTTRLAIVGYQGEGTLGREILQGAKQVPIFHEEVPVNATVTEILGLSAHADQQELINWFQQMKDVQKLFITHGEDSARQVLQDKIKNEFRIEDIVLPQKDSIYEI